MNTEASTPKKPAKVITPEGALRCLYYGYTDGKLRAPRVVPTTDAQHAEKLTKHIATDEFRADVEQYRAGHWCLIGRRPVIKQPSAGKKLKLGLYAAVMQ